MELAGPSIPEAAARAAGNVLAYPLSRLFNAILYGCDAPARQWLLDRFEVIGEPGAPLGRLQRGDLILRGGDAALVHAFLVADPTLRSAHDILNAAGRCEIASQGQYVYVADLGVRPHREEDRFARRVTEEDGSARRRQVVLRERDSAGEAERIDLTGLLVGMTLANAASRPPTVKVEVKSEAPDPKAADEALLPEVQFAESAGQPCIGIIGGDDRRAVSLPWDVPYRWICQISARQRKNGVLQSFGPVATGLLIAPRFVLTAAHVLKDSERDEHNQWVELEAERVVVAPGADGTQSIALRTPFGQSEARSWRLCPRYDPHSANKNRFDYALIELKHPLGATRFPAIDHQRLCFWGSEECGGNTVVKALDPASLAGATAYSVGYPEDLSNGTRPYLAVGRLGSVNIRGREELMSYDADGCHGQSGSPVWVEQGGKRCLAGIFTKIGTALDAQTMRVIGNEAVRLSSEVFVQISRWLEASKEDPWLYHADSEDLSRAASTPDSRWLKLFPRAERSHVDVLIDGAQAFRAIRDAIETANAPGHFIYILGWMLDIDVPLIENDPDSTLYNLLAAAVKRGVQLRVLVWDNVDEDYNRQAMQALERLRALPAKVGRPADLVAAYLDSANYQPAKSAALIKSIAPSVRQLQDIIRSYRRFLPAAVVPDDYYMKRISQFVDPNSSRSIGAHHEKLTLVCGTQGLIGFCGGIDYNCNRIGRGWCGPSVFPFPKNPSLHDVAARVAGPATKKLLKKFQTRWAHQGVAAQVALIDPQDAAFALGAGNAGAPFVQVVGTYTSPDGRVSDRSLKQAYLKIIDSAQKHIYIEDQYGVNLEVARHLNARLKDPAFEQLIIVLQDASDTSDILIPNRRREAFRQVLFAGLSDAARSKAVFAIYNRAKAVQSHLHRGMHAKTLIVDDEIAIIGSANVNRRSFTCDSESSVVIIDDPSQGGQSVVRKFRLKSWKEHAGGAMPDSQLESWPLFASYIPLGFPYTSLLNLQKFAVPDQDDLDVRVRRAIELAEAEASVLKLAGGVGLVVGHTLSQVADWVLQVMPRAVEELWNYLIDPDADG